MLSATASYQIKPRARCESSKLGKRQLVGRVQSAAATGENAPFAWTTGIEDDKCESAQQQHVAPAAGCRSGATAIAIVQRPSAPAQPAPNKWETLEEEQEVETCDARHEDSAPAAGCRHTLSSRLVMSTWPTPCRECEGPTGAALSERRPKRAARSWW